MAGFSVVVAVDDERGIGKGGLLPWRIPADMAYFRRLTTAAPVGRENAVIMGRRTWESIPDKFRPLPDRKNVVLSRAGIDNVNSGVVVVSDFEAALAAAASCASVFVIGGAALYELALRRSDCERLYITRVSGQYACDAFFPDWKERFVLTDTLEEGQSGGHTYRVEVWEPA